MNPTTIKAILNEADVMEERATELRAVAAQLQKLFDGRKAKGADVGNGMLLSAVPVKVRKTKPKKKTGAKRKYTKKSAWWAKK